MSNGEIILRKLDAIIGLLATQVQDDEKKLKILKSLGFTYREISDLTGIPDGTLKTWDHKKRKSKK